MYVKTIVFGRSLLFLILSASGLFASDIRFTSGGRALGIPFQRSSKPGLVFVKASLNGSGPYVLLLDTGASSSFIDESVARSLGLKLIPIGKVDEGTGAAPPNAFIINEKLTVSLPGVVMSGQSFAAVSLAKLRECTSSSTTDRFDGVFGRDFFKKLVVEIDHRNRTLGLHDPTLYKYGGEGQKIPLEIEKNFTYVRVTVEAADKRKVPARLVLDTGAGVGLWLTRDFAESNKLIPPDDALSSFEDCGIGGPTKAPARAGHLSALWLGRDRLKKPQVVFFSEPLIAGSDGFLGAPTLENYNATFDYGRAVLVLKRN